MPTNIRRKDHRRLQLVRHRHSDATGHSKETVGLDLRMKPRFYTLLTESLQWVLQWSPEALVFLLCWWLWVVCNDSVAATTCATSQFLNEIRATHNEIREEYASLLSDQS